MGDEQALNKTLLNVAEREQSLIAQELHDTLCQTLVGLSLLAKAALRVRQRGGDVDAADLSRISEHLDTAIGQSRVLVQPQSLAVRPAGLVHALEELARWSSAKIRCEFRVEGDPATDDPQLAKAFYRVARETLQNILREGKASRIGLAFLRRDSRIALEIDCDRPEASACSVFDGDGLLQRFAAAAGLDWTVRTGAPQHAALRVSTSSTD